MSIRNAMEAIVAFRRTIEDVFAWPEIKDTAHFIHEELCELVREIMKKLNAHYLRANNTPLDDTRMKMEYGDTLFMLLTLGAQLGLDPDECLEMSMEKIRARAMKKREEKNAGTA
jgi:NTP pyrophosphatase (non-canonical NTP hydrolase)